MDVVNVYEVELEDSVYELSIDDGSEIDVDLDTAIQINDADPYEGDYTVTPKVASQMLGTKGKVMADDVTVLAIPYYDTSNPYGTTIYIGSEV